MLALFSASSTSDFRRRFSSVICERKCGIFNNTINASISNLFAMLKMSQMPTSEKVDQLLISPPCVQPPLQKKSITKTKMFNLLKLLKQLHSSQIRNGVAVSLRANYKTQSYYLKLSNIYIKIQASYLVFEYLLR